MNLTQTDSEFTLTEKSLADKLKEIQDLYLSNDLPWVIGFSGGKDSSVIVQLVWEAIEALEPMQRKKKVYVISTDTLVESPALYRYIGKIHSSITDAASKKQMPFEVIHLKPKMTDSFWVNIIGKGYPAPTTMFRWCTNRMKIKPSDEFIFSKVSQFGEVILVLGLRKDESVTRAQSIKAHKNKDSILSRHGEHAEILIYTPIEDFKLNDVWKYLLERKAPWGTNNEELFEMYNGGMYAECAFAIDTNSKTCGGSRFGCWTCTVVSKDQATEKLINAGEKWLIPVKEIRDLLYSTTLPENKPKYRELKGRKGQIREKSDGSGEITRGPYKFSFCKELLHKILVAQKDIEEKHQIKNFKVIQLEELLEIRKIWLNEMGDWEDTVPKMYFDIFGKEMPLIEGDLSGLSGLDLPLLEKFSVKNNLPTRLLSKLIDVEHQSQGMKYRASIYSKIDKVLGEEWRTEEEILKASKKVSK
jgi:DNA sulfur modification protein DndC